jgi:hypothetical protein
MSGVTTSLLLGAMTCSMCTTSPGTRSPRQSLCKHGVAAVASQMQAPTAAGSSSTRWSTASAHLAGRGSSLCNQTLCLMMSSRPP